MQKPELVVMAAGLGSRYGGLKQIDPVGPNGEIIIDYSIYDALKASFGKIVFIIKKDIENEFKNVIGNRIGKLVDVDYVYQELTKIPAGLNLPISRTKPWGTGHAVLCCRDIVKAPFAVINADDFYGGTTFYEMSNFLRGIDTADKIHEYAMVGFVLEKTLTANGTVARGVCRVNKEGYLIDINERTKIKKFGDTAKYTEDDKHWINMQKNSIVSMNMWGFTPSIFNELEEGFNKFLNQNKEGLIKAEYYLPSVVDELTKQKRGKVKVLSSNEQWYGVTYKEDKPIIKKAIEELIVSGVYPRRLRND